MKIQARSVGRNALYGKTWEDCSGTEGLSHDECNEIVKEWKKGDQIAREHNEYRVVEEEAEHVA